MILSNPFIEREKTPTYQGGDKGVRGLGHTYREVGGYRIAA
jgi:hypothetical protein